MFLAYLIFGVAIFQVTSAALITKDPIIDKCYAGIDPDEAKRIDHKSASPEDDEVTGTLYDCVWKGKGVMTDDGTINAEKLSDYLHSLRFLDSDFGGETVNNLVEHCKDKQGQTNKHTAVKLKNCIIKFIDDLGQAGRK